MMPGMPAPALWKRSSTWRRISTSIGDYRTVSAAFEPDDYEQIIGLAWRHQFNDDRSKFKREIRELQEHVSQRIIAKLEQSE